MSRYIIAAVIVVATMAGSAYMVARDKRIDLNAWAVSGRNLGAFIFWFLSAGEIFTTFAFLGASGWAYEYGAPGFYILANAPLAYALGYWMLPKIWTIGKRHGLLTQADFYRKRFGTRWLGPLLAAVGIAALIPYLQLQFTGLGLILKITLGLAGDVSWVYVIAGLIVLGFVAVTGLRSVALGSIVKDVLMIGCLLGIGLSLGAVTHVGSLAAVYAKMKAAHPTFATLPGMVPAKHYTAWWYISTILMTNLGYWVWPHSFQYTFSGRSADVIRRNAIFQPLYTLSYFLTFTIGFAALLAIPHLKDSNEALLALVVRFYPNWFVGLLAAAGMLVAIVPGASLLLTAGTLFSQNIWRGVLRPHADDVEVLRVSRIALVVITAIAVYIAATSQKTLVAVLIIAYSAISQLAPSIVLGLLWPRMTAWGVICGVVVGLAGIAEPSVVGWERSFAHTLNTGFIALCLNFATAIVVSLLTRPPVDDAVAIIRETRPIDTSRAATFPSVGA